MPQRGWWLQRSRGTAAAFPAASGRAFLCGEGATHRKASIEARLELLVKHFAVSVCGLAILNNHLHIISSSTLALLPAAATKSLAATRAQQ
jgi:hypothetical protein